MAGVVLALSALGLATTVQASFENNLAFRSPYLNDRSLEIDLHSVKKRSLRRRQVGNFHQTATPASGDQSYRKYTNEVDHSDAEFIYAGGLNFTHGVASGDPYADSIILWTRAVPTGDARVDVPACVSYKVTTDANMNGSVIANGTAYTAFDIDWTAKVEATGLEPSTTYYYQWSNCVNDGEKSVIGRAKTAPDASKQGVESARFAIYSCSNYPNGFFNSYGGPVANDDVDVVMHLGDYIYENGPGSGSTPAGTAINRTVLPAKELATLSDYRTRYAQYRTDPDLAANHQMFSWLAIWDDHEYGRLGTANNDWKAGSSDSNDTVAGCSTTGVCFTERAANAKRAYFEWIPIRQVDVADKGRIWRSFGFGDLVSVIALDTRKYDRDITDLDYNTDYVKQLAAMPNSSRSITGPDQEEWFLNQLDESVTNGTKWRLVMNQVIFGTVNYSATNTDPTAPDAFTINVDSWDGYQQSRSRILDHIYNKDINDTVFVTGDTHANWLLEVNRATSLSGDYNNARAAQVRSNTTQYTRGQVVEFGGTAVSSSGWGNSYRSSANATEMAGQYMVEDASGLLWTEGYLRGYMNVYVTPDNVTTTYWGYPSNQIERLQNRTMSAQFTVSRGMNSVTRPLPAVNFGARKPGNF